MGVKDNKRASWDMQEYSGSTVIENGGTTGYDATATNITIVDDGIKAKEFNGTSSKIVFPKASIIDFATTWTSMTWELWFKVSNTATTQLFFRNDGQNGYCGVAGSIASSGLCEAFANQTGDYTFPGGYSTVNTTTAVAWDEWNHLVFTFDGQYAKLYLNGILEGTQDWLTDHGTGDIVMQGFGSNTHDVFMGYQEQSNDNHVDGNIRRFRIWTDAKTADEVKHLFTYGSGLRYPFNPNNL